MSDPLSLEALLAENRRLQELGARTQELEAQNQALQGRVKELEQIQRELEQTRRELEHAVAVYKRHLFGSRSEKIDAQELEARIAQAAVEAREQMAREKRPGDPPPEAEEEAPDEDTVDQPADALESPGLDKKKDPQRKARPHGRGSFPAHLPRRRIEHPVDPAQAVCAACADHPPLIRVGEDTCEKLVKLPVQYEVHVHVYPQLACQLGAMLKIGPNTTV